MLPYALYLGLVAILGHVAFVTLEGLGQNSLLTHWIKMIVVLSLAGWLLSGSDLVRRFRGPDWLWISFGAAGAFGTLLLLSQLGTWLSIVVFSVMVPFMWTGIGRLFPVLHYALLFLLLYIAHTAGKPGAEK